MSGDDGTLPGLLDASAARSGDGAALIWQHRPISFAAMADHSRRIAAGLAEAGIGRGDRVAIWLPNCPDWLALAYGCWRVGAAVVVLNIKASARDVADLVRRSDAKALACWPRHPGSRFDETLASLDGGDLGACRILVGLGPLDGVAAPAGCRFLALATLADNPPLRHDACRPDDGAIIYATSGSTGRAKLVLHAHAGLATHSRDIVRRFRLDAADAVQLLPLPFAGAYGTTQALASIAAGRPLVLMEAFEPFAAAELIRRHGVTGFCAFDELIHRLMEAGEGARPFPSLAWCGFGVFNPGLETFFEETERKGVKLVGLYGSSEAQAFFATQMPDAPSSERQVDGGWPLSPDARFRIRDTETGELLGPGLAGEIEIAGPSLCLTYLGDDDANAAQFCPDGFFRTGDSGRIGQNGSLVFETRMQDVLRLSGYLVASREIELVVSRLPGIERCQVVGLRTPDGSRPVAFVVRTTDAPLDVEAMQRACAEKLARYKVPIAFHAVPDFPMIGSVNAPKANKRRLGEMAAELAGLAVGA